MTVREMTMESVTESLVKLAAAQPDYKYVPIVTSLIEGKPAEAAYVPDGVCVYYHPVTHQPSCIVGHVFADHGLNWDDFSAAIVQRRKNDMTPEVANFMKPADSAVKFMQDEVPGAVGDLLMRVQRKQDIGFPWGSAVRLGLAGSF